MVGILVVSHGDLAAGILHSAEMIIGEQEQVSCVSLREYMQPEDFAEAMLKEVARIDTGDGVLCLIDLYGGTPFNVMCRNIEGRNLRCITGMNLAMLLDAVTSRDEMGLSDLAEQVMDSAKAGIRDLNAIFGKN